MDVKMPPTKVKQVKRERLKRCADWLVSQGAHPERLNAALPPELGTEVSAPTTCSVPTAVDEDRIVHLKVPRRKLRTDGLRMECDWRGCYYVTGDYDAYQRHVRTHIPQLHIITGPNPQYMCLWDTCGHRSADPREMVRHVNFHAYQSKLMAVGVNAQRNLGLAPCRRDSTKRHTLPPQGEDYRCLWVDCEQVFTAIQELFTHMKEHLLYSEGVCRWGGCGTPANSEIRVHARSHTKEKLIACGHCGLRYVNNALLRDHLQKQNIGPDGGFKCSVCGRPQATARLQRMHERQHVCDYACSYCDMTTPTLSALSLHIRYRHLPDLPEHRPFKCDRCGLAAKTQNDLNKHLRRHSRAQTKKERRLKEERSSGAEQSGESEGGGAAGGEEGSEKRRYICHMCPDGENKVFSRGARLSAHLMKDHGAQWPDGHCRFRYQKHEDGFYRLTTTRFENLEVSRQIMRGAVKEPITEALSVRVRKKMSATGDRPTLFAVHISSQGSDTEESEYEADDGSPEKGDGGSDEASPEKQEPECEEVTVENEVMVKSELTLKSEVTVKNEADALFEVTVCDVDESGNVIRTAVMDLDRVVLS